MLYKVYVDIKDDDIRALFCSWTFMIFLESLNLNCQAESNNPQYCAGSNLEANPPHEPEKRVSYYVKDEAK